MSLVRQSLPPGTESKPVLSLFLQPPLHRVHTIQFRQQEVPALEFVW